jgi:hypothetical protein
MECAVIFSEGGKETEEARKGQKREMAERRAKTRTAVVDTKMRMNAR